MFQPPFSYIICCLLLLMRSGHIYIGKNVGQQESRFVKVGLAAEDIKFILHTLLRDISSDWHWSSPMEGICISNYNVLGEAQSSRLV